MDVDVRLEVRLRIRDADAPLDRHFAAGVDRIGAHEVHELDPCVVADAQILDGEALVAVVAESELELLQLAHAHLAKIDAGGSKLQMATFERLVHHRPVHGEDGAPVGQLVARQLDEHAELPHLARRPDDQPNHLVTGRHDGLVEPQQRAHALGRFRQHLRLERDRFLVARLDVQQVDQRAVAQFQLADLQVAHALFEVLHLDHERRLRVDEVGVPDEPAQNGENEGGNYVAAHARIVRADRTSATFP